MDEAVNLALQILKEDERHLKWLRREVQKGLDSLDRGELKPWDVEQQVSRIYERMAEKQRKTNGGHR